MKLREQFRLDEIIKERAASLARPDLQANHGELTRRAKVLAALIECQDKIERIMYVEQQAAYTVGDISVNLDGGTPAPAKTFQPFDGGDITAQVAKKIRGRVV